MYYPKMKHTCGIAVNIRNNENLDIYSKCSVDDLDYGGGSLDPNALYKSRPLLTSTPKSTPTEEFFPKPFESDV